MKKKFALFSLISFGLAVADFVFSYNLYHYLGPDGRFGVFYHAEPLKPYVTLLFSILGVTFLSASILSIVVYLVFFRDKDK